MNVFSWQGRVVRDHRRLALAVLMVITIGLGAGALLRESAGDQVEAFLPESSEAAAAQERIAESFATAAGGTTVQVIARGDVLEPAAVQGVLDAMAAAAEGPEVATVLADGPRAVFSYAHAIDLLLGDVAPGEADREQITEAIRSLEGAEGQLGELGSTIAQFIARDADGRPIGGLGVLSLSEAPQEEIRAAALAAEEVISSAEIPGLEVRTFSPPKLDQEISESQTSTTVLLMSLAFLVIVVLLVVFYRSASDVALSLAGLVITVVWIFGLQGLLGPGGLDVVGPSNPTVTIIPVLLIGLVVDFALQLTGRYREGLAAGDTIGDSAYTAVRRTGLPLLLAAATTAISFLTNLTSPIPPLQDFGLLAAIGIVSGYVVMTTLVPAARSLLDERRSRAGKELRDRALAESIPGTGRALAAVARVGVRHPVPILFAVVAVGALAGVSATRIDTTFSTAQFLPSDSETARDLEFLDENFAGGTARATLLVEGELDDRLARDVIDLEQTLASPDSRPDGVTGPPRSSLLTLIEDYAEDSGLPGDDYSAEFDQYLEQLDLGLTVEPSTFREIFDQLRQVAPDQLARVLSIDEDGLARTIIDVPITAQDQAAVQQVVDDLQGIWQGEDDQFVVTGQEVLEVSIAQTLTENQARSIAVTIIAALIVLVLYFGLADLRPVLGALVVLPIALVVVLVLGTMVALGVSYNVFTALITALTIGVGVDYTVHLTHRFIEELEAADGDVVEAMTTTMRTTGAALVGSALTTALGFAVLLFSPLTPIGQFGILTALTILYSLLAAFLVLPPMLSLWSVYHRWRSAQKAPGDSIAPRSRDDAPSRVAARPG
ncbi:efflux RND transporter permease subunit [Blastococcus sp. SYSU DS0617]